MPGGPGRADPQEGRPALRLQFVLGTLLAFASISTDLYLPALPAMSRDLGASQGAIEMTISAYLLGFGLGQLFWGPVSDRYGRRVPVALGIAVFVIGSVGCALAADALQIVGWRVVQALGASAGVVLGRAIVRDLYDRDHAARLLSTLMTIVAIAPLIGPLAGAQLLELASWRAIFWLLVAIGAATVAAIFTLPETLAADKRAGVSPGLVLAAYGALFANRLFLGYAAAIGFFYAGMFAIIAGTPFAYIDYHGLSPNLFALLFAAGIVGLIVANFVNARLVRRVGSHRMLLAGTLGAGAFGAAAALQTATDWGGIHALFVSIFLFTAMNGFVLANAVAGALASVPTRIGAASALVGAIQYGGGMIGAAAVGILANGTPTPMGWVLAVGGSGAAACVAIVGAKQRH